MRLVLFFSVLFYTAAALAETSFQFNMAGAQIPPDSDVDGARIVFLYGKNKSVDGFDLGLASFSESENQGGFSANMGLGRVTGKSSGGACSLINIHSSKDTGLNAAFINIVKTITGGANVGFVNITEGMSEVDIGGLSMSQKSNTQVGFVNFTDEIVAFQIGFLNFAQNGVFPFFPIVNFPKK